MTAASSGGARAGMVALTLGALGVVFGDIGTSPLYAIQSVFFVDGGIVHPTEANVYGIVSLVFWTITLIVSVKYVTFVMRADNDGEGGIMALVASSSGRSALTAPPRGWSCWACLAPRCSTGTAASRPRSPSSRPSGA